MFLSKTSLLPSIVVLGNKLLAACSNLVVIDRDIKVVARGGKQSKCPTTFCLEGKEGKHEDHDHSSRLGGG
jgi:predicted small secreted protein